jgi:hypothetical protein
MEGLGGALQEMAMELVQDATMPWDCVVMGPGKEALCVG